MTDNEIKKALKCCTGYDCENCKALKYCDYMHPGALARASLNLITRQKTENENLKVENQSLRTAANSLKMHYEEAQAEVERLKGSTIVNNIMESQRIKREAKSEAVKEFAERLKKKRKKAITCEVVIVDDIDNLVKEMVGENNSDE